MNEDDILKRVPPQNLEAEQGVLGSILLNNEALQYAQEILAPEDFYQESHREIFKAMLLLSEGKGGDPDARRSVKDGIDAITITNVLRSRGVLEQIGGPAYLAQLSSSEATWREVQRYARIVREKAILRQLGSFATDLASQTYEAPHNWSPEWTEELIAVAEYEIARIASRQIAHPEPSKATALATALWKIEHGQEDLVLTGFAPLDQSFGGFNVGHLTVLAARPSKGKTAFATNIAINAAKAGSAVAFFTLEMTAEEMWLRALGCESQVDLFSARRRGYKYGEKERIEAARVTLESLPLQMLYRPSMRPRDLRVECRRLARAMGPLKLIIVDYFNLMRGDRREKDRWREMQEAVLALKELAGELGLPILLLSQLNRDTDESAPPALSNLRDTGATEEHASNVLFIWQRPPKGDAPMTYNDWEDIEVIIGKQRNGPAGLRVPMQFAKKWGGFVAR